jgi:maltose alpha-D-glucosyltransferase/alpha-amylase
MLELMNGTKELRSARGSLRGIVTAPMPDLPEDRRWTRDAGDQTNSLAFVGDQYVVKLFRRIEPGPNPELEIGRALIEQGFTRTPEITRALEYARPGLELGCLALVQTAVKHQGSGWDYTVDELRRFYERVAGRAGKIDAKEDENWYLTTATTLGRRTGEMHLALARVSGPAFAPEPLDSSALGALIDDMRTHAEASLRLLEQRLQR